MKKILSLLLSVCLVVTMIPAISFAADGDQASGDGNVVPMGTQEEIVGEGSAGDPEVVEGPAETAGGEEPSVVENPVDPEQDVNETPESEVPDGNGVVEEPPVVEGQQQVFNAGETGWKQVDNGWKYFTSETSYLPQGMQKIPDYKDAEGRDVYHFFDANGYMQTGIQTYDSRKYYFEPSGNAPSQSSAFGRRQTGLITISGSGTYYFNPEMKTGWQSINGNYYYFASNGKMTTGWLTLSGKKYYFAASGVRLTGTQTISGQIYYFNPEMKTGVQTINGKKYYFASTGVRQTGMQTIGGEKYYFNPEMKTGWQTISGKKYYFNSSGAMQTGWATINGSRYYFKSSGLVTTGWASIGGSKYYFNSSGVMKTGWLTIKKNKYYLNPSSGRMAKGWTKVGSKKYFFNTKSGAMKKGWLKYKKKKYYLNPKTGVMMTGMKKIGGSYYFFNKNNGAMKSNGCEKVSKKLYYFFKNGSARWTKGWFKGSDKKKRYCLGKGVLATGKKKIGSNWYIFSKTNGTVTKSLGDDLDQKVQSKSSDTRYLIAIKRSTYEVRVYIGSKNDWTRAKSFKCAIGMAATPTKTGTYTISDKGVKKTFEAPDGTPTRYWYWCYYTGTHGIHSGLYYDGGPNDGKDYDTRVGVKSTNGGIRVDYSNARWIYNNVPVNTTVVVY